MTRRRALVALALVLLAGCAKETGPGAPIGAVKKADAVQQQANDRQQQLDTLP